MAGDEGAMLDKRRLMFAASSLHLALPTLTYSVGLVMVVTVTIVKLNNRLTLKAQ